MLTRRSFHYDATHRLFLAALGSAEELRLQTERGPVLDTEPGPPVLGPAGQESRLNRAHRNIKSGEAGVICSTCTDSFCGFLVEYADEVRKEKS